MFGVLRLGRNLGRIRKLGANTLEDPRLQRPQAKTRQIRLRAVGANAEAVVSLYSAMVAHSLEAMSSE